MPKYILHKRAFYYDGEYYEPHYESEDGTIPRGKILGTFSTLEEAQEARIEADIEVIVVLEDNIVSFIALGKEWKAVIKRLAAFFEREFPNENIHITTENWATEIDLLPDEMSREQILEMLEITQLSFHDICEYPDGVEPNPDDFRLPSSDYEEFPLQGS